jgi:hypothetical protein
MEAGSTASKLWKPQQIPPPQVPPEIFYNTIREKNPSQNGLTKRIDHGRWGGV